jgi:hypothetical protein
METETKKRRISQLQTKLYHVEDVLATWGPLRMTLRQCFVLLLGGCGSLNLWQILECLSAAGSIGSLLRMGLALLPTLLAVGVAYVRVADRSVEAWAGVLLEYVTHARRYEKESTGDREQSGQCHREQEKRMTTRHDRK